MLRTPNHIIDNTPSATATADEVRCGRSTAGDAAAAATQRIAALEPSIHAWQVFDAERALEEADGVDRRGGPGLLAGAPIAVKDIFDTTDMPTRYGSPIYEGHRPQADADCVARVRAAGAVVMGKTVTTEFAYFTPGPTANPWNNAHTPGGSSSGSAAAVASGMVPLAFGSQTAGSLIRPASYCGILALKPTHGAFSLAGSKAFAPSLDTLGWLARTADDLELMRCALSGQAFEPLPIRTLSQLRLGICHTHEWQFADEDGARAFETAIDRLRAAGVTFVDAELPGELAGLMEAQKTVMAREAAQALAHEWRTARAQLSAPLAALITAGQQIGDAAYADALKLAAHGRQTLARMSEGFDAVLAPSAPGEAPAGLLATGDPVFSRVWTLLGLPCTNVPGLFGRRGLPIGVQLVGAAGDERNLLEITAAVHALLSAATNGSMPTAAPTDSADPAGAQGTLYA